MNNIYIYFSCNHLYLLVNGVCSLNGAFHPGSSFESLKFLTLRVTTCYVIPKDSLFGLCYELRWIEGRNNRLFQVGQFGPNLDHNFVPNFCASWGQSWSVWTLPCLALWCKVERWLESKVGMQSWGSNCGSEINLDPNLRKSPYKEKPPVS